MYSERRGEFIAPTHERGRGRDIEARCAEGESSRGCTGDVQGGDLVKYPMLHRGSGHITKLQWTAGRRAGHGNVCTAAPLFPGQTALPAPAFYPRALAKPREGWLSAVLAALLPLPSSAGNRILFIYQVTVERGISG